MDRELLLIGIDDIIFDEHCDESVAFILESNIAEEVIDNVIGKIPLYEGHSIRNVLKIIDENDTILLTVNRYGDGEEELFVEALFYKEDKQLYIENDITFIQCELLDTISTDNICAEIRVLCEECGECEK